MERNQSIRDIDRLRDIVTRYLVRVGLGKEKPLAPVCKGMRLSALGLCSFDLMAIIAEAEGTFRCEADFSRAVPDPTFEDLAAMLGIPVDSDDTDAAEGRR